MSCKNCGNIVKGNFCSNCGQNVNVSRINFRNFLNEISEGVLQINKGFFYTLRQLSIRPGSSIKEFLNGKRKPHFKPLAYLLSLSTVYFILTQITNQSTWIDDIIQGWMTGATNSDSKDISKIANWFSKNFAYSTLILLPVFSLASYLSFYKFGKNYLEHVVLNSYITGQQAIFYLLSTILGMILENDLSESLPLILAVLYTFWVFWQFFSEGNRVANILRTVLTYMLYFIFGMLLLALLVGTAEF